RLGVVQILAKQTEQDAVGPVAVPPVGPALHPLADEADSLGVPKCTLVQAVDLELEPVEPELVEQMKLEQSRRLVGQPAAAEVRVDGKAAQARDPASLVLGGVAHDPGRAP